MPMLESSGDNQHKQRSGDSPILSTDWCPRKRTEHILSVTLPTVSGNQPHLVGRGSGGSTGVPTGALDFSDPLDSG